MYFLRLVVVILVVFMRNDLGWIMVIICEIGLLGCVFVKVKYEFFKYGLCINFFNINIVMEICVVGRFKSEFVILM